MATKNVPHGEIIMLKRTLFLAVAVLASSLTFCPGLDTPINPGISDETLRGLVLFFNITKPDVRIDISALENLSVAEIIPQLEQTFTAHETPVLLAQVKQLKMRLPEALPPIRIPAGSPAEEDACTSGDADFLSAPSPLHTAYRSRLATAAVTPVATEEGLEEIITSLDEVVSLNSDLTFREIINFFNLKNPALPVVLPSTDTPNRAETITLLLQKTREVGAAGHHFGWALETLSFYLKNPTRTDVSAEDQALLDIGLEEIRGTTTASPCVQADSRTKTPQPQGSMPVFPSPLRRAVSQ